MYYLRRGNIISCLTQRIATYGARGSRKYGGPRDPLISSLCIAYVIFGSPSYKEWRTAVIV